jgi:hypothetical protein
MREGDRHRDRQTDRHRREHEGDNYFDFFVRIDPFSAERYGEREAEEGVGAGEADDDGVLWTDAFVRSLCEPEPLPEPEEVEEDFPWPLVDSLPLRGVVSEPPWRSFVVVICVMSP